MRGACRMVWVLALLCSASMGASAQSEPAPVEPASAQAAEGSSEQSSADAGPVAMEALPAPRTLEDGSQVLVVGDDWDEDGFADSCTVITVAPGDLLVSRGSDPECDGVSESELQFASCPQPHDRCVAVGTDVGIMPDGLEGDYVLNSGFVEIPSSDPTRYNFPAGLTSGEPLPGAPWRACTEPSEQCPRPDTSDCRCDANGRVYTVVIEPEEDEYGSNTSYRRFRYDADGRVVLEQEDFGGSYVFELRRYFYDSSGRVAGDVVVEPGDAPYWTLREWDGDRLVRVSLDRDGAGAWNQITEHVWEGGVVVQTRVDLSGLGELISYKNYVRDEQGNVIAVRYSEPDGPDGDMTCYLSEPCSRVAYACPQPDMDTCEFADPFGDGDSLGDDFGW